VSRSRSWALLVGLALFRLASLESRAQTNPATAAPPPTKLDYPDNVHGLEHLAKDIMKAQKEGNESRALELAQSMVLPDPASWYLQTFGPPIATDEGAKYAANRKNLPAEILKFFFGAIQSQFTDVTAARFGDSCDDNAGESAFGTLQLRLQRTPLYELRLQNGDRFLRLFAIVFVDGVFRYALAPRVPDHFPFVPRKDETVATKVTNPEPSDKSAKPIRVGGTVQAAKVVRKVAPDYPDVARREHLQGTVRLHAIIGKDGAISPVSGVARVLLPGQGFNQSSEPVALHAYSPARSARRS